jgi:micrococcal nuclease
MSYCSKILCVLFCTLSLSTEFEAKVVGVVDGDTIDVLYNSKKIRIRLNGIDCPEKSQAFGAKAKQFTSGLVYDRTVKVKEKEFDRYGRTIADIYLIDGRWLNKMLLDSGFAWHYKRYSSSEILADAEQTARKKKIGLWADKSPVAPWDFRRQ